MSGNLVFAGSQTLGGSGSVLMGQSSVDELTMSSQTSAATLTIGSGITIHGTTGVVFASAGNIVNQGTIVADSAGGFIQVSPTLLTNQGSLTASNGGTLLVGGLTGNVGTATVSGAGTVLSLPGNFVINPGLTVTNGASLSLNGNFVVDQGLTAPSGTTLSLSGTWTNSTGSTISASGATLTLGSSFASWRNQGTITATNSTVNLGGDFTFSDLGIFNNSGSTVNLTGRLENSNTTLTLGAATGSWDLYGGTIVGGSYSASGGAELLFTSRGGTLQDVTADSDLDLATNGGSVTINDGLTLNHANVLLGNASVTTYGSLYFAQVSNPNLVLGGTGTIVFGAFGVVDVLGSALGVTLTIGSGITVEGSGGTLEGNPIVNKGTIDADSAGFDITVNCTFSNQGTLEASNGGGIHIINSPNVFNSGPISVGTGSQIVIAGNLQQSGGLQQFGSLSVAIGGTAANQYGSVSISGSASLRGILNVNFVNGYAPNVGDTLPTVLTYRSVSGSFAPITTTGLPANERLTPTYGATSLTLTVGAAQRPSDANGRPQGSAAMLTASELAPIVAAAIARWAESGISTADVALLRHAKIELADLGGNFLGLEGDNTILIDRPADGYGWFIDATPMSDQAFVPTSDPNELNALAGSAAAMHMDLLTVVMHELGHVLGLGDVADGSGPDTLMSVSLPIGVRRLPDGLVSLAADSQSLAGKDDVFGRLADSTTHFAQTVDPARLAALLEEPIPPSTRTDALTAAVRRTSAAHPATTSNLALPTNKIGSGRARAGESSLDDLFAGGWI
jgi:hypothetical protein